MDILTAGEDRIKSFVNSLVFFLFFTGCTYIGLFQVSLWWPGWLARLHLWLHGKGEDETVAFVRRLRRGIGHWVARLVLL